MSLKKHGLGRGLEALLADTSINEEKPPPEIAQAGDDQSAIEASRDEIQSRSMQTDSGIAGTESGSAAADMDSGSTVPPSVELRPASVHDQAQQRAQLPGAVDKQAAMAVAILKNIQRENLALQQEAGALRQLIEELESIVRDNLS
jgi:hypothetical protein